jgi:hypothetical protein
MISAKGRAHKKKERLKHEIQKQVRGRGRER